MQATKLETVLALAGKPSAWGRQVAASKLMTSPVAVGALAAIVAAVFVVLRTVAAAHGHVGGLVVAGSQYVRPSPYTSGVPISPGSGYDGQFYYRLALGPLDWSRSAFGITFDTLGRSDRVAFPALVWLVSVGHRAFVPTVMPLVNVVALGTVAGLGTALARSAGRHPLWGLLIAGFFGFLWTLSRDLTELTEAAFVLGGLLALRASRPILAGLLLAGGVLAREPALLVVGGIFASRAVALATPQQADQRAEIAAVTIARHGRRKIMAFAGRALHGPPGAIDAAWLLPALSFAGWQLALRASTGSFGVLKAGRANTGVPFVGLARGFVHYVERLPSTASLLWVAELGVLAIIGAMAAFCLRKSTAPLHEQIAWVASAVLALLLTKGIWLGDVGFRSLDDFFVMSVLLLLSSRLRLEIAGLAVATMWVVVAVELLLYI